MAFILHRLRELIGNISSRVTMLGGSSSSNARKYTWSAHFTLIHRLRRHKQTLPALRAEVRKPQLHPTTRPERIPPRAEDKVEISAEAREMMQAQEAQNAALEEKIAFLNSFVRPVKAFRRAILPLAL